MQTSMIQVTVNYTDVNKLQAEGYMVVNSNLSAEARYSVGSVESILQIYQVLRSGQDQYKHVREKKKSTWNSW